MMRKKSHKGVDASTQTELGGLNLQFTFAVHAGEIVDRIVNTGMVANNNFSSLQLSLMAPNVQGVYYPYYQCLPFQSNGN